MKVSFNLKKFKMKICIIKNKKIMISLIMTLILNYKAKLKNKLL